MVIGCNKTLPIGSHIIIVGNNKILLDKQSIMDWFCGESAGDRDVVLCKECAVKLGMIW